MRHLFSREQHQRRSPFLFLFWLLIFACGCSNRTHGKDCSWNNCPNFPKAGSINDDVINVHLICHSHDDLGWIINVDEYFSRLRPELIPASVEHIYNTVLIELERDPTKKFSFAETGFLTRWIESHDKKDYKRFQRLVANGQIELIGGGWVQPDEAASHYIEIIDQYTLGLRKLNDSYGECGRPKINWQVDPFGHSREHANIAVGIGYEALFFARAHHLEHLQRVKNKSLEFVWSTSDDFKENQILTGQFFRGDYGPPPGYCFDVMCADDPIVDSPTLQGYNVDAKVDQLIKYVRDQVLAQKHRNVMLLMGSDFHYTDANMIYTNIDKLMKAANSRTNQTKITFQYSTPSCYVKSLTSASPHLTQRTGDFFPYASANHSYWTGYFTSKPVMKGLVRSSSAFLQLVRFFDTFALSSKNENSGRIEKFERAVALSQHHDAVTGTSKENVTKDYERRLLDGWNKGEESLKNSFSKLAALKENETIPPQTICLLSNESVCLLTKSNKKLALTIYNGYSQAVSTVVRIPYYSETADINGPAGEAAQFEIVKTFLPKNQLTSNDSAEFEIHLPVDLPALGFKTFFLNQNNKTKKLEKTVYEKSNTLSRNFRGKKLRNRTPREISSLQKDIKPSPLTPSSPTDSSTKITNGIIELTFDENGRLSNFKNVKTNFTRELSQQFFYYESVKKSKENPQPSGAYIFRPVMIADSFDGNITIEIIKGKYIQEVRQTINNWVTQSIRLIANQTFVEFDWIVGPILKEEKNATGKEIISRYTVKGLKNNGVFYTDSNGRQLIKRVRNSAEFYTFEKTEPIAGNYYPVPSRIIIADDKTQLSILTDRSQGGTSLADGNVELMLHRRMYDDDNFGVEEALDEPGNDGRGLVARGRQWLILESKTATNSQKAQRQFGMELFHSPIITYAPITSQSKYRSIAATEFSGLHKSLPENIHLLTLKQISPTQILLRLEHYLQNGEDGILAQPSTINLVETFSTLKIISIEELNLAGTTKVGEMHNLPKSWNRSSRTSFGDRFTVQLNPMEIKTFLIEASFKSPKSL